MSDNEKLAGGVWPYGDPTALGATPIDVWAFAAQCQEISRGVLAEAGVDPLHGVAKARQQIRPGTREDVALSLFSCVELSRMFLAQAADASPGGALAEAAAGGFANMGMLRFMLDSMSQGMTDAALTGSAVKAASLHGRSARTAQSDQDVMDRWGRRALAIAKEFREKRPSCSKAAIAREIRKRKGDGEPNLMLPENDRNIIALLSKRGF